MAFSRKLVQSLLYVSRNSSRCVFPPCKVAEKASFNGKQMPERAQKASLDPGENGLWRRPEERLAVVDVRKILRISQLEKVKSRLRDTQKGRVSYMEFLQICVKECSSVDQGLEFAKNLDESGSVIIMGNTVFLRPEQLVKAIQVQLVHWPSTQTDSRRKQLQEMEKQKAGIDKNAESQVRNELWCGLGCLIIQTAVFMRLTFWDLTWDVMEPICFYVTSFYAVGAYTFFLTTSKEPSFQGFFQSRFRAKQKRLMRLHNFDLQRYNQLKINSTDFSTVRT